MKLRTLAFFSAMTLFVALAITAPAFAQKTQDQFITFDAPGAVGPFQGTYPTSINQAGTITGYYIDASIVFHGFVRDKDETIMTFDAAPHAIYSYPTSINPAGEITGYFINANESGPLRAADGTITTFDAGPDRTYPVSINPRDEITGSYSDASNLTHGFLLKHKNQKGSEKESDDEDGEDPEF